MTLRTVDLRKEELPKWSWKADAIEAIHRFAEFRFTADGRVYSMSLGCESIGYLMLAQGSLDFREHQHVARELRSIEGAIVVCDEQDEDSGELLVYRDRQELIDAWRELRQISGVAMR